MDVTMESAARFVVAASAVSLFVVAMTVLARELMARRPEPVDRDTGPLALVNYAGSSSSLCLAWCSLSPVWGSAPPWPNPLETRCACWAS